jgi:hypothetical protein
LIPISTSKKCPKPDSGTSTLALLLDNSNIGKLIPQIWRQPLQKLIELKEAADVLIGERCKQTVSQAAAVQGA